MFGFRPAVLLLVVAGVMMTPTVAQACSCGGPSSIMTNVRNADRVFVGSVRRLDGFPTPSVLPNGVVARASGQPTRVTFEILRSFSGRIDTDVELALDGGSCAIPFTVGQVWLMYVSPVERVRIDAGTDHRLVLSVSF